MPNTVTCACSETVDERELISRLDEVIDDYAARRGALIPVLQIAQGLFGYLPEKVLRRIAHRLDKSYSEVAGVVSFYSFFSTAPRGKNLIRVCLGTACYVRGGKQLLTSLKQRLGIDVGQTTPDRLFSLDIARCFGACGLSPVVMINETIHQRVKPSTLPTILSLYAQPQAAGRAS